MKLDTGKIWERFCIYTELTSDETTPYLDIVNESEKNLASKILKKELTEEDLYLLNLAAAALAFYKYTLLKESGSGITSLKLGELNLAKKNNAVDEASLIWKNAKAEVIHLINDEEFVFTTVAYS